MTVLANITIKNGAATPVDVVFTAIGVRNGVASWKDKSTGIPAGFSEITYSLREPSKAFPAYKMSTKISVPKLEVSPAFLVPTKAYESLLKIEAVLPDRCTAADRADLYAYGVNLLANALLRDGIKNTESVWG